MPLNSFVSNQGTQTAILTDNTGGTGGTVIAVQKVDISSAGTAGTLWNGNVGVSSGTITSLPNIPGGSIVMTNGTLATLPNLPQGSIQVTAGTIASIGTIGTLGLGTITGNVGVSSGTINVGTATVGTIPGIGSISNIGSLGVLNAGTLTTIPNIPGGSIVVTTGTVINNGGSVSVYGVQGTGIANTTNPIVIAGTSSNNGTIFGVQVDTAGRVIVQPSGVGGTLTNLGTLTNIGQVYNAGTLQNGTLSPIPTIANVTYGTHGTTGVSIFGTLAGGTGSGAGTEIFITSLSLSIPSTGGSQDASIGWGTNGGTFHAGTGLLVRGNFPPGGGIQKTFWPPVNSGTQAQLCLFQAGAGTVDVNITYFITTSSL